MAAEDERCGPPDTDPSRPERSGQVATSSDPGDAAHLASKNGATAITDAGGPDNELKPSGEGYSVAAMTNGGGDEHAKALDDVTQFLAARAHRGEVLLAERPPLEGNGPVRSEERRVGKECRSRWS